VQYTTLELTAQVIEQPFRLFEVRRVEAFGEPVGVTAASVQTYTVAGFTQCHPPA
jgi:hypothetical protein